MSSLPCQRCGENMPGIHAYDLRWRCYDCGGLCFKKATFDIQKRQALESLKANDLIALSYEFKGEL